MSFASKPEPCRGCPLYDRGRSFVPPAGPPDAQLVLVGQGPGEQEAHRGVPFVPEAPSGWRLTQWLYQAHVQRTDVALLNTVWCWKPKGLRQGQPWGNEDPTRAESQWCWNAHVGPWFTKWDRTTRDRYRGPQGEDLRQVVPVGVPAIKWLMGLDWDRGAERYAGTSQRITLPTVGENHASRP